MVYYIRLGEGENIMKFDTILFDLDGTLTNPKEGITKSVQYALAAFGIVVSDLDVLTPFIGPPLTESFVRFYSFSQADAQKAVSIYRERFSSIGLYENVPYQGIASCLSVLKQAGKVLAVATSKPECFSKKILEHFALDGYFDVITGSELDGTRVRKAEVIAETLYRLRCPASERVVMVGDRMHDILGAKSCGICTIGVKYGFAEEKELEQNGAAYVCDSVSELQDLLLS